MRLFFPDQTECGYYNKREHGGKEQGIADGLEGAAEKIPQGNRGKRLGDHH